MKPFLYTSVCVCLLLLPHIGLAQDARQEGFVPLIGIPGLDSSGYNINAYVNILYVLSISIAAFIVVLRLILAGFKYMLTDVVPQKENAKKEVGSALLGLLLVLGAVLILNVINPKLTQLDALDLNDVSTPTFSPYGIAIPDRTNTSAQPGDEVNLDDATEEEIAEFRETCANQNEVTGPATAYVRTTGVGRCQKIGDQIVSSDPDELAAFQQNCHDSDITYERDVNSFGDPRVRCLDNAWCENGVNEAENRCISDVSDGSGANVHSCIDPADNNLNFDCTQACLDNGGEMADGNCSGASVIYQFN